MLKKLATILVAVGALAVATPVFACPHSEDKGAEETKTAKKTDKENKKPVRKPVKKAPKKGAEKPADTVATK